MNRLYLVLIGLILTVSCTKKDNSCIVVIDNTKDISIDKIILKKGLDNIQPKQKANYLIFSFKTEQSDYYSLIFDDNEIEFFMSVGDSVFVSSDNSISGSGAIINNFIINAGNSFDETCNNIDFDSIYSLSPLKFSSCIDSIYNLQTIRLDSFIKVSDIEDYVFISTEKKKILHSSALEKNRYYRDHKFLTGNIQKLDSEFESYLNSINFNDSSMLKFQTYRDFLFSYFEKTGLMQVDGGDKSHKFNYFTEYAFNDAISTISNQATKDYTLFELIWCHFNTVPIDSLGSLITKFNDNCRNTKYKEKINNYFEKLHKLKKGMPAPDFSLPDKNGNMISLSDFKGKMVYIDVWNSTCSPCFKEFPILHELEKELHSQEIVFVGVSSDQDKTVWEKTLINKKLEGIQLFSYGENNQFQKDYLIYYNPRFILIDKNGKIVSANALRPSENIIELIKLNL